MKAFPLILKVFIVSLMVTIPSGSFFFHQYISQKIAVHSISADEVNYAIKQKIVPAIEYRFKETQEGTDEWFYLAKQLAKKDKNIAYELATIYHIENDIPQAIHWYKKSVELKHEKALTDLIDLFIAEGELIKAKQLLLSIKHDEDSLNKLIEVNITLGDTENLPDLVSLIKDKNKSEIIKKLTAYQVITLPNYKLQTEAEIHDGKCDNSVQLFATNLEHLQKLDTLVNNIKDHAINRFFCFNKPRYISKKRLQCTYNKNSAIQCNEAIWSDFKPEINSRYVGLMLDEGGANVNNGILYIDSFDTHQVFIHELSHLLGFIDEYPLSSKHKTCQKTQQAPFSHNIAILKEFYTGSEAEVLGILKQQLPWFSLIEKTTPIIQKRDNKWFVGTPMSYTLNHEELVGLFKAETCNNNKVQAFMPTVSKTSLRYYEESFISTYVTLLTKEPKSYLMPSYHYNVAKALFHDGKERLGLKWLHKALNREINKAEQSDKNNAETQNRIRRYHQIKKGEF